MKILAIETSSIACSVALLNNGNVKERHEIIPQQHAKRLLTFIEEMLDFPLHSLDFIAWGCGPGSFTGLRIAASVIQAISFAHSIPIVSVSSLAALAQTAYWQHGWRDLLVALDARMQEVYWGYYHINQEGYAEIINKEIICRPLDIPVISPGFGVGDGWSAYSMPFKPEAMDANCLPKALAVAMLARLKYERRECLQPFDALPVYLREENFYGATR